MSPFSSVDDSADPAALVASLDASAAGLTAMKHYMAAAARRAVGDGLVVDIGCGAGHDLELLTAAGVRPLGLEPSAVMLSTCRDRLGPSFPLVRADGAALPFRDASVDGCRMERVLQHVADVEVVVCECARVVRPRGFLAVFDADWDSLVVESDSPHAVTITAAMVTVPQRDIGRRLVPLVTEAGFVVLDEVTEASTTERLAGFPVLFDRAVERARQAGRVDTAAIDQWVAEQRARDASGKFRAAWTKVLVIAERRAAS